MGGSKCEGTYPICPLGPYINVHTVMELLRKLSRFLKIMHDHSMNELTANMCVIQCFSIVFASPPRRKSPPRKERTYFTPPFAINKTILYTFCIFTPVPPRHTRPL